MNFAGGSALVRDAATGAALEALSPSLSKIDDRLVDDVELLASLAW